MASKMYKFPRKWKYYWYVGPGQKKGVTAKQKLCYEFIRKYFIENGESPTYKDIGEYCDCQPNNVGSLIKQLKYSGLIHQLDTPHNNLIPHDYFLKLQNEENTQTESKDSSKT